MMQLIYKMERAVDIGSGISNVYKYLSFYSKGASVEFIEGDMFSTVINLSKTEVTTEKKNADKIPNKISQNPKITIVELVKATSLSRRGVEWNIDKLEKVGFIKREGSKKQVNG